jgi:hypothetical protein
MTYRAWMRVDVEDDDAAAAVAGANYKAAGGLGTVIGAVTAQTDHPDSEVDHREGAA